MDDNMTILKKMFVEFYSVLIAYCVKFVKDLEAARDIVQDIFLKVLENQSKIDFSRPMHSYFLRLAHNQCMDYLQRLKVEKKYVHQTAMELAEIDLQYDHLFEQLAAKILQERIDQVVEQLPEQCRIIFCKSRYEGMSHQEIARDLNISVRTVETQIYRALKILKNALKDYF
jgi:RNA polymerase sigma-70 factor (ECF subfamily)